MNMLTVTERNWNNDASCVTNMRGGVVRLNCSKGDARIVAESPIYLPGTTVKIVLRGAPAIDPNVNKGVWMMFCNEFGKETRQELDLLELSRFGKNIGHTGWINYHEVSGEKFDLNGFDAGSFDEYEISGRFWLSDDGKMAMEVSVFAGGNQLRCIASAMEGIPHYANLKIGCFCIPNDGPRFKFARVADRGPLFVDIKSIEITRPTKT